MDATERLELPGSPSYLEMERDGQPDGKPASEAVLKLAEATLPFIENGFLEALQRVVGLAGRQLPRRTPFALRALLLAFEEGRFVCHEDLRAELPLAPDQDPGRVGIKYRSFYQEAPVALAGSRVSYGCW